MQGRHTGAAVATRRDMERRLRGAIHAGALTLEYQPVVDLLSGRVTGVEALARWHDPELGNVPPDAFIPLAESTGLIHDLGLWALRTACTQADQWVRDRGPWPCPTVAVNVSPVQLTEPTFIADVVGALDRSGLPADRLCLEVTETAAVTDLDETAGRLRELRGLGVQVALDDFGTGYSSLTMLRRLPVNIVKIDRSFVRQLTANVHDAVLIRLVVDAAHNLGMRVCAEGVEEEDQARHLRAMGCDAAQGWHFGRPLPPSPALSERLDSVTEVGDHDGDDAATALMSRSDELVLVTTAGVITYASSSSGAVLGWSPAELVGTRVTDHLHPDDVARIEAGEPLPALTTDGESTHRLRHRDGSYRWLLTTTRGLDDDSGPAGDSLTVSRDVTAAVRATQALAESEAFFRHAFDDAPIGMAITGLDGAFLRVNRAFAEMLGTTAESLLGRCVDDVTHEDDRTVDAANIRDLRAGRVSHHRVAKRYVDTGGRPVPAVVHAALVNDARGQPSCVIAHVLSR